jgi:hypothetical protein
MFKRRSRAPKRKDDSRSSPSPGPSTTTPAVESAAPASFTSTNPPAQAELDEVDAGWDELLV